MSTQHPIHDSVGEEEILRDENLTSGGFLLLRGPLKPPPLGAGIWDYLIFAPRLPISLHFSASFFAIVFGYF